MILLVIYVYKIGAIYFEISSSITCFVHYCNVLYSTTTLESDSNWTDDGSYFKSFYEAAANMTPDEVIELSYFIV